jgi:hypothetical protein
MLSARKGYRKNDSKESDYAGEAEGKDEERAHIATSRQEAKRVHAERMASLKQVVLISMSYVPLQ